MTLTNADIDKMDQRNRKALEELVLTRLDKIEQSNKKIQDELDTAKRDIQDLEAHAERIDKDMAEINSAIKLSDDVILSTIETLDREVHDRKWCLTIVGLAGDKHELAHATRFTLLEFAQFELEVPCPRISACHRLNWHIANSAIYVRFTDLSDRDLWLSKAKSLRTHPNPALRKIFINVDIPPALLGVKKDILDQRRALAAQGQKTQSSIIYEKSWPYMLLKVSGEDKPRRPTITLENFVTEYRQKKMDSLKPPTASV